ncbi:hypothetical protein HK105_203070 [Polyrhizophydium stewartii]|uniref:Major facilitator superfamily (MFS) profile domain-containing protein n=1 Tax=Polyrhizophydium stewartii TaxID=2732419 RepID=A0ABR4ND05_9FUNG
MASAQQSLGTQHEQTSGVTLVLSADIEHIGDKDAEVDKPASSAASDGDTADAGAPVAKTTNIEFALILLGLAMAVFLASLDQTIVSVAIPAVAQEFKSLDEIAWIGTAFFLTSTAFIPTYGKLADIFGRKPVFLLAVFVFEIGSIMCGASTSMKMLIVSRAVAGLGGGGIFSLAIIIISDLVPLKDRAKYQGLIGACFGLASVAGPLLGGLFTDKLSWRWNFYINGPVGAITIVVSLFILKLPHTGGDWRASFARVDFLGTAVLVAGVITFLIPIQGGGTLYEWNSPTVISLFIVGAVLLIAFVLIELRVAKEPIMPLELFTKRYALSAFASAFFLGMSFFGAIFYTPVYFQVVNGDTATQAGINTIPLIMGMVVFSISAGVIASSTGHYMPLVTLGGILITIGLGLMSTLGAASTTGMKIGYLIITGAGLGFGFQSIVIASQASVEESYLAVVTSISNFWQTIGAVFGLAITSSVFNNKLKTLLAELATPTFDPLPLAGDPTLIRNRQFVPTAELQAQVIDAYVKALSQIFIVSIPFAAMLVVMSLFVKRTRLSEELRKAPAVAG